MNWEWIARRLLVLGSFGYETSYDEKYLAEPDFLTDDWLADYYGEPTEDYVLKELHEVDRKVAP